MLSPVNLRQPVGLVLSPVLLPKSTLLLCRIYQNINILSFTDVITSYDATIAVIRCHSLKFAHMRVASVLGLIIAVPMAFVVVLSQVNGLQDTAKGLVPSSIDPVFGTTTFVILLLSLFLGAGLVIAVGAVALGGR